MSVCICFTCVQVSWRAVYVYVYTIKAAIGLCKFVFVCSEQPPQHHSLSVPGFSSEDLQESQFGQELQPLTVCRLHLTEHTLRTFTHTYAHMVNYVCKLCHIVQFTLILPDTHTHLLTISLECSEEGGEQSATHADIHQFRQGVQSQLRGEVVEKRVWVFPLILLHQLQQVLHRGKQIHKMTFYCGMRHPPADDVMFNIWSMIQK